MIVANTLNEIGVSLGLPSLAFSRNQVAALALGDKDTLFFERLKDGVIMSMVREFSLHQKQVAVKALALCDASNGFPLPVRAGITAENKLVFSSRFTESTFTVSAVSQAMVLLKDLLNKAL